MFCFNLQQLIKIPNPIDDSVAAVVRINKVITCEILICKILKKAKFKPRLRNISSILKKIINTFFSLYVIANKFQINSNEENVNKNINEI